MRALARRAAPASFARTLEIFESAGFRVASREGLAARLEPRDGVPALSARLTGEGRIFGGNLGLEVSTAEPVLPATRGLSARGRGLVRLARVGFRARRGDHAGQALARRLDADKGLQRALAAVDFEVVRVEPDGRPVVRHLGGSVVWVLFPPVVRRVPINVAQVRATVAALRAFSEAGR
jgi:hypothetical protein